MIRMLFGAHVELVNKFLYGNEALPKVLVLLLLLRGLSIVGLLMMTLEVVGLINVEGCAQVVLV
jgi:hypothetical protein